MKAFLAFTLGLGFFLSSSVGLADPSRTYRGKFAFQDLEGADHHASYRIDLTPKAWHYEVATSLFDARANRRGDGVEDLVICDFRNDHVVPGSDGVPLKLLSGLDCSEPQFTASVRVTKTPEVGVNTFQICTRLGAEVTFGTDEIPRIAIIVIPDAGRTCTPVGTKD